MPLIDRALAKAWRSGRHSPAIVIAGHGAMSIAVTCNKCRSTFQVKDKYAGRPGACPHCHESVYVPAAPLGWDEEAAWCETELEIETLARSSPATPTPYLPPAKINFPCEACGHPLRAEAINSGRKVRCSACDHKFLIPPTSLPIPAPAPKSVAPSDVKPVHPAPIKPSPPPRQPRPVRDPRMSRPRKLWGRSRKQAGTANPTGIWTELTEKDLEGGSDARPSTDPLEPGPHNTPKVPSFVRAHTPLEYRDES